MDRRTSTAPGAAGRDDGGFTLVEAVVATVLLSVIMSSMAALFVKGSEQSNDLRRRQAAVTLAQQALEAARAASPVPDAAGCVQLLQGRTAALVAAQWATAPVSVTSITDSASAPPTCTGPLTVPLQGVAGPAGTATDPVLLQNLPYTVQTFIGTCVLTTSRSSCLQAGAVPAGSPALYRVVARVTWTAPGCAPGPCEYSASTFVDPSPDPLFNVRGAAGPVAADDTACIASGTAGMLDLTGNDSGALGPTPVTVTRAPAKGTLSTGIASGIGSYTPAAGATGTDSFAYRLTDVNGLLSGTASVTVTLGGC